MLQLVVLARACCFWLGCLIFYCMCFYLFLVSIVSLLFVRLRETRVSQWTSLYLDEWGEEDINLKRGKPLYLNPEVSFY